ncbi:ATP-dependent rRNA helicase RRP3 [Filimonas sp.]|nr:ATP-dependent rRNA helicase RRP3 [Filimonas sp.]
MTFKELHLIEPYSVHWKKKGTQHPHRSKRKRFLYDLKALICLAVLRQELEKQPPLPYLSFSY